MNFVQDLTIDVGSGNPGAIAINYLANNIGAVRNFVLRAGDGEAAAFIPPQARLMSRFKAARHKYKSQR